MYNNYVNYREVTMAGKQMTKRSRELGEELLNNACHGKLMFIDQDEIEWDGEEFMRDI